ncbi:MAG: hypothetical protein GEV28_36275, partial [Actinophytocola sp.]|nr:hypothetical protein [Actinophytocola sp.]
MLGGSSEGALTSDSCETANRSPSSATILCERGTEPEVLDEISSTPGAIGKVDLPSANEAKVAERPLTVPRLGERYPDVSGISAGYPFWTIEYLYPKGEPEDGALLASFIDFLRSGTARAEPADDGYPPCVGKDGQTYLLRNCLKLTCTCRDCSVMVLVWPWSWRSMSRSWRRSSGRSCRTWMSG